MNGSDTAGARETPIGFVPESLDLEGLTLSQQDLQGLLAIDPKGYLREMEELESYFSIFGDHFSKALRETLDHTKAELMMAE